MFSLHLKIKDFNKKNWKEGSVIRQQVWDQTVVIMKLEREFQVLPLENNEISCGNFRKVAKIKKINDGFEFKHQETKILSYSDDFWMVVGKKSSNVFRLAQGDTFQVFGSVMILKRVSGFTDNCVTNFEKSIFDACFSPFKPTLDRMSLNSLTSNPDILHYSENFCRICLETSDTPEDPFFNPCKCSGGMGFIHLNCFDQWINSKFQITPKGFYTEVIWENLYCENCLSKIHEDYSFPSSTYNIFSRITIYSKYLMILKPPVFNSKKNFLFLVNCSNLSQFFIGKNYEFSTKELKNSLKILINDNEILAENKTNQMFFSVLVQKSFNLMVGSSQKFLNGSSVFELSVTRPSEWKKIFCSCLKP
jgi:hypothetical protein